MIDFRRFSLFFQCFTLSPLPLPFSGFSFALCSQLYNVAFKVLCLHFDGFLLSVVSLLVVLSLCRYAANMDVLRCFTHNVSRLLINLSILNFVKIFYQKKFVTRCVSVGCNCVKFAIFLAIIEKLCYLCTHKGRAAATCINAAHNYKIISL